MNEEEKKSLDIETLPATVTNAVPTLATPDDLEYNEMKDVRSGIRRQLAEIDAKNDTGFNVMVWDELSKETDTNEVIRLNIIQEQMHIQRLEQEYLYKLEQDRNDLLDLLGETDESKNYYRTEKERLEGLRRLDRKELTDMKKASVLLCKEYRSCLMQKKYYTHMGTVQRFALAIQAVIHENIHDERLLKVLSDGIGRATQALFPVDAQDEF